ncbi:MAG: OmpA family protein [Polyangiaceae bacterium]|nr:OmpA family protein [Polyangiaceae bacterium]
MRLTACKILRQPSSFRVLSSLGALGAVLLSTLVAGAAEEPSTPEKKPAVAVAAEKQESAVTVAGDKPELAQVPAEEKPAEQESAALPQAGPASPESKMLAGSPVEKNQVPPYAGKRAEPQTDPGNHRARFATEPWLTRFRPQRNTWEFGGFLGAMFPSKNHNIKVNTLEQEEYRTGVALGARFAYFPLSFFGTEAEGMSSWNATKVTDKSALIYSFRASAIFQVPLYSIVPFAVIGGGTIGAFSESMGHDRDGLFHWGVGVKGAVSRYISLRLDFRDDLHPQYWEVGEEQPPATHSFELLFGTTITLGRRPPPAPVDSDYDGLSDRDDVCPHVGALTLDGCPSDRDADGINDALDDCPTEPGDGANGCPNRDADEDGVIVPCDLCPTKKGVAPDGCPVEDVDGDGLLPPADACPQEAEDRNGFEDDDGCPDTMPDEIKSVTGILDSVSFEPETATLLPSSAAELDQLAGILLKYKTLRIEVSGHMSNEGDASKNQDLSQKRAETVKADLVSKGIDGSRVQARGAGSKEPIGDNQLEAGREKNQRLEVRVLSAD